MLDVIRRFFQAIITVMLLSACLIGQSQVLRYQISGSVKDEEGAVIQGVKVKLVDKNGNEFEDMTRENGRYIVQVPAGIYSVSAEYSGHKGWQSYSLNSFDVNDRH